MGACFVWPKGALHPFWSESGIQSCESGIQSCESGIQSVWHSLLRLCCLHLSDSQWLATKPLQTPSAATLREVYLHLLEVGLGTWISIHLIWWKERGADEANFPRRQKYPLVTQTWFLRSLLDKCLQFSGAFLVFHECLGPQGLNRQSSIFRPE